MEKKSLKDVSKNPGIYLFTNKVNNKHYVGRAMDLRKRLQSHLGNLKHNRYDNPLYRALNKYGIENFSISILIEIKKKYDKITVSKILDKLEIYYIEKYDSFGKNGYNQTKGGDGGILGYKMTPEQIEKIRQSSLNTEEIYALNIKTKEIFHAKGITNLSKLIDIHYSSISRYLSKQRTSPVKGLYIFNTTGDFTNTEFKEYKLSKYTLDEFKKAVLNLQNERYHTQVEIAEKLNICKNTVCNYVRKLKEQGIFLFNTKQ